MKTEVIYPWQSEIFFEKWSQWKQYKKEEFRFSFKGVLSEQSQLMRLVNLSDGNEDKAIELIDYAMSQSWRGLYPLPINNKTNGKSIIEQNRNEFANFFADIASK